MRIVMEKIGAEGRKDLTFWLVSLVAGNGSMIMTSEKYRLRRSAIKTAKRIAEKTKLKLDIQE